MNIGIHNQDVIDSILSPRRLHLILFPTEQCNFRCSYCYEDFKVGAMHPEVVTGTKLLLAERIPELDQLDISWFGGEPLLAKDVVFDIAAHISKLVKDFPALKYAANMTTNGFLLDLQTFQKLVSLGVRLYQISLDGDCELHDLTRRTRGGKDTFAVIWKNLLAIRDDKTAEAAIMIRVHYSPDTWTELLPLIEKINREFSDDERFEVYFKSVERLGGDNDAAIRLFDEEAKREVEGILKSHLRRDRMAHRLTPAGPYICYASKANSFAIRANGEVAKCTVALYDERNQVGKLNADGSLTVNQVRFKHWLKGLQTLDPALLACPYASMKKLTSISVQREKLVS